MSETTHKTKMSKKYKLILLCVIIGVLCALAIGGYYQFFHKQDTPQTTMGAITVTPTPTVAPQPTVEIQ